MNSIPDPHTLPPRIIGNSSTFRTEFDRKSSKQMTKLILHRVVYRAVLLPVSSLFLKLLLFIVLTIVIVVLISSAGGHQDRTQPVRITEQLCGDGRGRVQGPQLLTHRTTIQSCSMRMLVWSTGEFTTIFNLIYDECLQSIGSNSGWTGFLGCQTLLYN